MTGLEVVSQPRVESDDVIVVDLRLSTNQHALTIDKVVAKLKKSHLDLVQLIEDGFVAAGVPSSVLRELRELRTTGEARDGAWFNVASNFKVATEKALDCRRDVFVALQDVGVWDAVPDATALSPRAKATGGSPRSRDIASVALLCWRAGEFVAANALLERLVRDAPLLPNGAPPVSSVSQAALSPLLQFLYCGSPSLTLEQAADVLQVSHEWKLERLFACALGFVGENAVEPDVEAALQRCMADDFGSGLAQFVQHVRRCRARALFLASETLIIKVIFWKQANDGGKQQRDNIVEEMALRGRPRDAPAPSLAEYLPDELFDRRTMVKSFLNPPPWMDTRQTPEDIDYDDMETIVESARDAALLSDPRFTRSQRRCNRCGVTFASGTELFRHLKEDQCKQDLAKASEKAELAAHGGGVAVVGLEAATVALYNPLLKAKWMYLNRTVHSQSEISRSTCEYNAMLAKIPITYVTAADIAEIAAAIPASAAAHIEPPKVLVLFESKPSGAQSAQYGRGVVLLTDRLSGRKGIVIGGNFPTFTVAVFGSAGTDAQTGAKARSNAKAEEIKRKRGEAVEETMRGRRTSPAELAAKREQTRARLTLKPKKQRTAGDISRRPNDWDCMQCGALVFASKSACFACAAERPPKVGDVHGGAGAGVGRAAPLKDLVVRADVAQLMFTRYKAKYDIKKLARPNHDRTRTSGRLDRGDLRDAKGIIRQVRKMAAERNHGPYGSGPQWMINEEWNDAQNTRAEALKVASANAQSSEPVGTKMPSAETPSSTLPDALSSLLELLSAS